MRIASTSLLLLILVWGCGVENKPKYDQKTYGVPLAKTSNAEVAEPPPVVITPDGGDDFESEVSPVDNSDGGTGEVPGDDTSGVSDGTAEGDDATDDAGDDSTDSQSDGQDSDDSSDGEGDADDSDDFLDDGTDVIVDPGTDDGGTGDGGEDPGIDPETLILNNDYQAAFDQDSALRLRDGRDPSDFPVWVRGQVLNALVADPEDGVVLSQTFGDGVRYSTGRQIVINRAGDANVEEGDPSQSGLQTYQRVTGDASCPGVFVCIDKLVFEPESGPASTWCYKTPDNSGAAIPYAIAPNYLSSDFDAWIGTYGPYVAEKYPGNDVDCSTATAPSSQETFSVEISRGSGEEPGRYHHDGEQLPFSYEMVITNTRTENDNVAPYLDESSRLQYRTRFLIDEANGLLVKMIKTVRKSLSIPLVAVDGLIVDLHLEFCENLLADPPESNYCTTTEP